MAFGRIMAETRDLPEWFYESEIETLSDNDLIKTGRSAMEDMTGRQTEINKGI